jgi:uncharacterized protein YbaP (TraB family)
MTRFLNRLGLLFIACTALAALPARAQPPVWVVHGPHATVVLFGSVHLLAPGIDWEPPVLKTALAQADDLWFEIPIDPASALGAQQYAIKRGLLPEGQTLSAELTSADRDRLANAAKICGLPVSLLDRLRPWYADLALSVASTKSANADAAGGVEQTLSAANPALPRKAFETVVEQIGFLAVVSDKDQIDSLRETMSEVKTGPAFYKRLVDAWLAGDVTAIRKQALEPMIKQAPGEYRALVADRNKRWIPRIEQRLAGHGEAVMVVGVGHLVGPDSVPALLRRDGFRVDGP